MPKTKYAISTRSDFPPKSFIASVLASAKSFVGMALLPSAALGNLILNGSSKGISPTLVCGGGGGVTRPRLGCLGDVATDLDTAASSSGMCKERSPLAKSDWKPPSTLPEWGSFPKAELIDAVLGCYGCYSVM